MNDKQLSLSEWRETSRLLDKVNERLKDKANCSIEDKELVRSEK